MAIGMMGRKAGMTRVFAADGSSTPVTVIELTPNRIAQVKTLEKDGYSAIQVTSGEAGKNALTKAEAGHFAKNGVAAGKGLMEFRLTDGDPAFAVGAEITVELFEGSKLVDVTGTSKGKGFAGAIKRWNFAAQDATHGNSLSHRAPGSLGQNQSPGRVFKGKKMTGHLGDEQVTVQSLEVVRVDKERNLLLVKGAVPGATGGKVVVRPAVKA